MTTQAMLRKIDELINKAKTAVLATVDKDGQPHMRWMTPTLLRGRPNAMYAVTSPSFAKLLHLGKNAHAQWLIQAPSLRDVITLDGVVNVLDVPTLKTEVMDALGPRLFTFWKVNPRSDFIVLETVIHAATYFTPMSGEKVSVAFT
jgi:pyridoxamine 5'-phosphate oxidase